MKINYLILLPALLLTILPWVFPPEQRTAHAASQVAQRVEAVISIPAPIVPPVAPALEPSEPEGTGKLAGYVLEAFGIWKPTHAMKRPEDAAPYAEVARDIALVVLAAEPLPSPFATHPRTAILLGTLAYFEGGLLAYVDDGRVNNAKWREQSVRRGQLWSLDASDRGEAWSLWQIHTDGGIALTANGEWEHKSGISSAENGIISGPMLARDRKLAVRVALAFLRKSLRVTRGLVGYSGETADTGYNKAHMRSLFATNYSKRHPYP